MPIEDVFIFFYIELQFAVLFSLFTEDYYFVAFSGLVGCRFFYLPRIMAGNITSYEFTGCQPTEYVNL